jgi:hypothetical protein
MNADDETNITDIELLPDGRVYVFGASAEVLDVLDQLQSGADPVVTDRLHLQVEMPPAANFRVTAT